MIPSFELLVLTVMPIFLLEDHVSGLCRNCNVREWSRIAVAGNITAPMCISQLRLPQNRDVKLWRGLGKLPQRKPTRPCPRVTAMDALQPTVMLAMSSYAGKMGSHENHGQ